MKWKVCFLGSPEFSIPSLEFLKNSPHFEVVGAVTQPDRPAGRKLELKPTAVKTYCLTHQIPVISPEKVSSLEGLKWVEGLKADVAVVVAFGQILSEQFLSLFPFGAVNLHGSLLPRWRGAAPIQRAIEAGDSESGLSLQKIVKALDAGDLLGERRVKLNTEITALELLNSLSLLGPELLGRELVQYLSSELTPLPQNPHQVTLAPKITKTECELDFAQNANLLHNKIRAFTMGPGAFSYFKGHRVKIIKARVGSDISPSEPGMVVSLEPLRVVCGQRSVLEILELQPESKSKMPAKQFVQSFDVKLNEKWGSRE